MQTIKAFYYKDELYVRLVPSKMMFRSTMIHEVVNRGDVFAMRMSDQQFTVVPGEGKVTHIDFPIPPEYPVKFKEPEQIDMFLKEYLLDAYRPYKAGENLL